jgi:hypothetical protein
MSSRRFLSLFGKMTSKRQTLLGVGPMSQRIVDETIGLANELKKPIALIPSRRQIECRELGGGYVNNWDTSSFAKYVRGKDVGEYVFLSRDHSGPWQFNELDSFGNVLTHQDAIKQAKLSLVTDINSGFDLLHIDPSPGLKFGLKESDVEHDIVELIDACHKIKTNNPPLFEVGADEQSMTPDLPSLAGLKLERILGSLKSEGLPSPLFYVLQTGTKVKELRNVGSFASYLPTQGMLSASFQIPEIIEVCNRYKVYLKEHNADYLPDESLAWHRRFGIPAANVAPEFGVSETKALLSAAKSNGQSWFVDDFSEHVVSKLKWKKWLVESSNATLEDKVLIAGHYHFSDLEIVDSIAKLENNLLKRNFDLDFYIRSKLRNSLSRYLKEFGYHE